MTKEEMFAGLNNTWEFTRIDADAKYVLDEVEHRLLNYFRDPARYPKVTCEPKQATLKLTVDVSEAIGDLKLRDLAYEGEEESILSRTVELFAAKYKFQNGDAWDSYECSFEDTTVRIVFEKTGGIN